MGEEWKTETKQQNYVAEVTSELESIRSIGFGRISTVVLSCETQVATEIRKIYNNILCFSNCAAVCTAGTRHIDKPVFAVGWNCGVGSSCSCSELSDSSSARCWVAAVTCSSATETMAFSVRFFLTKMLYYTESAVIMCTTDWVRIQERVWVRVWICPD